MIVDIFTIPIYDVRVTYIQIEGPQDATPRLKRLLNPGAPSPESLKECLDSIKNDCVNGGDTWRNLLHREIVCLIYKCTSVEKKLEIIGHEKRHIEDRILQFFGVNDIESSGLLAGFLTNKMIKLTTKTLKE